MIKKTSLKTSNISSQTNERSVPSQTVKFRGRAAFYIGGVAKATKSAIIYTGMRIKRIITDLVPGLFRARKNPLILSEGALDPRRFDWDLNRSLLNDAEEHTTDSKVREQIGFLKSFYLHKIAPLGGDHFDPTSTAIHEPQIASSFKLGRRQEHGYFRTSFTREDRKKAAMLNQNFGMPKETRLVLSDSTELEQFYAPSFHPLGNTKEQRVDTIVSALEERLTRNDGNAAKAFKGTMLKRFLFDITEPLGDRVYTNGDPQKEELLKKAFYNETANMEAALNEALDLFFVHHPDAKISRKALEKYIRKNTSCVSRVQVSEGLAGIKLWPAITKERGDHLYNHRFMLFLQRAGLTVGAIQKLRHLVDHQKQGPDVKYTVTGPVGIRYFESPTSLLNSALLHGLGGRPGFMEELDRNQSPHVRALGLSITKMLEGMLKDIQPETWNKIHEDPARAEAMQASLFKIANHLASARLHMGNFNRFASEMELVQVEFATILELSQLYEESDFNEAFRDTIDPLIPAELQGLTRVGLGKTAGNMFAGINAASFQTSTSPVRAYAEGFYFEQMFLMGEENSFERQMQDPECKKIDLYVGGFHPNVSVGKQRTIYGKVDLVGDVRRVLREKPETEHLTVAVDGTIDYSSQGEMQKLIQEFSEEIQSGKINLIFFKSGQKFDIVGMDNFYGSPYYMINNGAKQWDAYNALCEAPAHKTDPLSLQWFTLSNKYAAAEIEEYRRLIFDNSRKILDLVPESLSARTESGKVKRSLLDNGVRINVVKDDMLATFVDIKIARKKSMAKTLMTTFLILGLLLRTFAKHGISIHARHSFGFFHPNVSVIYWKGCDYATIRVNPGISEEEIPIFEEFFKELEKYQLN